MEKRRIRDTVKDKVDQIMYKTYCTVITSDIYNARNEQQAHSGLPGKINKLEQEDWN